MTKPINISILEITNILKVVFMANKKKAALLTDECVACGCCVKSCPMGAISIYKGLHAIWNPGRI